MRYWIYPVKARDAHNVSVSTQIDRELAAAALRKRAAGKRPNREEARALRRVEKAREAADREKYYQSIPAKHYQDMSGCSAKVRKEQATRYRLPIGGPTINLYEYLPAVHRLLADISRVLPARYADPDADVAPPPGVASPAMERVRLARAQLLEMELAKRRGEMITTAELRKMYGRFFRAFRKTADALQRLFGPKAAEIFEQGRAAAEADVLNTLDNAELSN